MSQHLSASLAQVTAVDPLRAAIFSNLRTFLPAAGLLVTVGESNLQVLADENADLASALCEKLAVQQVFIQT